MGKCDDFVVFNIIIIMKKSMIDMLDNFIIRKPEIEYFGKKYTHLVFEASCLI